MDMSLSWAEFVSSWANWILVGALVVGVLATYGIVVSSNVKEAALKRDVSEANKEAGRANERAASLEKEAAEARERTAKTELQLEQLRQKLAPRAIDRAKFLAALDGKPKPSAVEILYTRDDPDSFQLAFQLSTFLFEAGWVVIAPKPLPQENPTLDVKFPMPSAMSFGGQPEGISVVGQIVPLPEQGDTPGNILMNALLKGVPPGTQINGGRDQSIKDDWLRLIIAPKKP